LDLIDSGNRSQIALSASDRPGDLRRRRCSLGMLMILNA